MTADATSGDGTISAASERRPRRREPDRRVVMVTGARSFLGRRLLRRLEADRRFATIIAVDISGPDEPLVKTQFCRIDLTEPAADRALQQLIDEHDVDTVVHLAFLGLPTHQASWSHELETIGTLHLLNACTLAGVSKVVMRSSTMLYDAHPQNPNHLDEAQALRGLPDTPFISDKIEAERLVERYRAENPRCVVTVLRFASLLGRGLRNLPSRLLSRPIVPTLMGRDPLIQLLDVDDAVDALKLCIDADFDAVYNIAAPGVLPLRTVVALAGRLALAMPGIIARPLLAALWSTDLADVPASLLDYLRYLCVADTRRSRDEMGFTPHHDIRAVLRRFTLPPARMLTASEAASSVAGARHSHGSQP